MGSLNLRAHFDGKQIQLDDPFPLPVNAKLLVTVLPEVDDEAKRWELSALTNLARAYGPDEPDYPLDSIKEANPDYEGG